MLARLDSKLFFISPACMIHITCGSQFDSLLRLTAVNCGHLATMRYYIHEELTDTGHFYSTRDLNLLARTNSFSAETSFIFFVITSISSFKNCIFPLIVASHMPQAASPILDPPVIKFPITVETPGSVPAVAIRITASHVAASPATALPTCAATWLAIRFGRTTSFKKLSSRVTESRRPLRAFSNSICASATLY